MHWDENLNSMTHFKHLNFKPNKLVPFKLTKTEKQIGNHIKLFMNWYSFYYSIEPIIIFLTYFPWTNLCRLGEDIMGSSSGLIRRGNKILCLHHKGYYFWTIGCLILGKNSLKVEKTRILKLPTSMF